MRDTKRKFKIGAGILSLLAIVALALGGLFSVAIGAASAEGQGHRTECFRHEGGDLNNAHGTVTNDGAAVTLNQFNQSWFGDHWESIQIKGGPNAGPVIGHPSAGVAYFAPDNPNSGKPYSVSWWKVCKGETPATPTTTTTVVTTTTPTTTTTTTTIPPTTTTEVEPSSTTTVPGTLPTTSTSLSPTTTESSPSTTTVDTTTPSSTPTSGSPSTPVPSPAPSTTSSQVIVPPVSDIGTPPNVPIQEAPVVDELPATGNSQRNITMALAGLLLTGAGVAMIVAASRRRIG